MIDVTTNIGVLKRKEVQDSILISSANITGWGSSEIIIVVTGWIFWNWQHTDWNNWNGVFLLDKYTTTPVNLVSRKYLSRTKKHQNQ